MTAGRSRVLHVITGLSVGGAEKTLLRLVSADLKAGRTVMVAAWKGGGPIESEMRSLGVRVIALVPQSWPSRFSAPFAFLWQCRTFAPDIIVGWMYHGILLGHVLRALIAPRARIVWNVRASLDALSSWSWSTRAIIARLPRLARRADCLVYNSSEGRRQHEAFGFRSDAAVVIQNGVDLETFHRDDEARVRVRAEWQIGDALVVGHVARYHSTKAQEALLRAFGGRSFGRPIVVVMIGRGVTPANASLRLETAKVGGDVRALLLGERGQNYIAQAMNAMDIFCLTSTAGEGFPNVVAEAMATGVPCIVTDVGDAARIVGDSGFIVRPGDVTELGRILGAFASMPCRQRIALGTAAMERVRSQFAFSGMVEEYQALYRRIARP